MGEKERLEKNTGIVPPWYRWGPYVSERAWGTVREDYSKNGDAWNYLTHDMAISKAYRWGEDGIAGICDRYQVIVLSFAFWNGQDSILKERLFGISGSEGNHGEDVKENYYYLDSTPTHSYMKFLYKYPHKKFPYEELRTENQNRGLDQLEHELIDTGVFEQNRYFDIFIEYAKDSPEDLCVKVEVFNRGPDAAELDLIPQLTFRKRYCEHATTGLDGKIDNHSSGGLHIDDTDGDPIESLDFDYKIGNRYFYGEKGNENLFTNNETNTKRLYGKESDSQYVKDAFHRYIIDGEKEAINPAQTGTKACMRYPKVKIEGGQSKTFYFRFTDTEMENPLSDVEKIITEKKGEADEYYATIHPKGASEEENKVQRAALSGMLWGKQIYLYNVHRWLKGDDPKAHPMAKGREEIRNKHWKHLVSMRILSMPDKWEYPWFAAWDLAFQTVTLALVDFEFAKDQLWLLLFDQFQHPNGQIPAYEWEFSELNPPVQAWAALKLYEIGKQQHGKEDKAFLKRCYNKLVINFVWWVNKVDEKGNNVFEGGFLGLDNITVIDRSVAVPGGGKLEQSDGTGWMGFFCLCLMRIALILAEDDAEYEHMAIKFFEHYVYIAAALQISPNREVQIWNEEDGFFYDVISYPNGGLEQIKVRSLVGLIPMYAIDGLTEAELESFPSFKASFNWFLNHRKDLVEVCITPFERDGQKRWLLALMSTDQMKRVLERVWDPEEFRSKYGLRSLSKHYAKNPYTMLGKSITYEPGEAISSL
ncbi:MAG: glucosidase, partial [Simkaniaceae bacterium]|nr:glucosidase [Simkaniaceae bacterium]